MNAPYIDHRTHHSSSLRNPPALELLALTHLHKDSDKTTEELTSATEQVSDFNQLKRPNLRRSRSQDLCFDSAREGLHPSLEA
jgi:hypothetical protein